MEKGFLADLLKRIVAEATRLDRAAIVSPPIQFHPSIADHVRYLGRKSEKKTTKKSIKP